MATSRPDRFDSRLAIATRNSRPNFDDVFRSDGMVSRHTGLRFDAAVTPPEREKGEDLPPVSASSGNWASTSSERRTSRRTPAGPYLTWPVFRRSIVAAFAHSLTFWPSPGFVAA